MSKQNWTAEGIPDQSNRIAVITGSNSGIGFETAKVLAGKNAEVILAVRNREMGNKALEDIMTYHAEAKVKVMMLDLANLASVNSFSEAFKSAYSSLDLLINNAGIMMPPYGKTVDGFESQLGTNHFGHFALTSQLFELLKATPHSRIVNVSSNAHNMGSLNFDDLQWENRKYSSFKAYGDSKIANLYFTFEMARKLKATDSHILSVAAHPGLTETNLAKSKIVRGFNRIFAQSSYMGALPTLMAACDPDVQSGDYFGPSRFSEWRGYPKKVQANRLAQDAGIASRLWDVSERLTGQSFKL